MDRIILKYFELALFLFLFIFIIISCSTKNQKIVKSDNTINVNIEKIILFQKAIFQKFLEILNIVIYPSTTLTKMSQKLLRKLH